MPTAYSWDAPGLTWSSSISWDSAPADNPSKTMNTKAIIDFSDYSATALGDLAQVIHNHFVENAATFPNPPVALATFQTQITDYTTKRLARESRASADILAFNLARTLMETTLTSFGNYVNTVAKGDPAIVELGGVPSYQTGTTPDLTPPGAPQDLNLRHGEVTGSILFRCKTERRGSVNEVQIHLGDPNDEAGWVQKALIKGGKGELTGFPPGIVVWVRIRTIGIRGIMGAWSDPAQIRTL